MSREMKNEEIDKFEKKFGYKPTKVAVAIDTLAVFVNKGNPIKSLTMQQVDAIFSKTRKGGHAKDIKTWGDLGLTGDAATRTLSLYGRNSASGTYGYFKEHALFKGDFKDTVKEQPGSSSVVQSIGSDRFAIGYSGIGYTTSGVRALPLADEKKNGGAAFAATYENALSGKYPLSRYLYVYVNKHPKKPLDPLTREFLKFALSREGQEIVVKDGFLPLTAKMEADELAKLN
jgi:phosphate transport system substrate-binding protein